MTEAAHMSDENERSVAQERRKMSDEHKQDAAERTAACSGSIAVCREWLDRSSKQATLRPIHAKCRPVSARQQWVFRPAPGRAGDEGDCLGGSTPLGFGICQMV